MKTKSAIAAMIARIERESPIEFRMALLMALEWASGSGVSTSQGLEDWLADEKEAK